MVRSAGTGVVAYALGLAVLASLAAARSTASMAAGADAITALLAGYHTAFLAGAGFGLIAALLGGLGLRTLAQADAVATDHHSTEGM